MIPDDFNFGVPDSRVGKWGFWIVTILVALSTAGILYVLFGPK